MRLTCRTWPAAAFRPWRKKRVLPRPFRIAAARNTRGRVGRHGGAGSFQRIPRALSLDRRVFVDEHEHGFVGGVVDAGAAARESLPDGRLLLLLRDGAEGANAKHQHCEHYDQQDHAQAERPRRHPPDLPPRFRLRVMLGPEGIRDWRV